MDACFRELKMPSKMETEDMNNNPLDKVDGETNSGAVGEEVRQCGEECNPSNPNKAAEEAEFFLHLKAISKSDITIAEEKNHLIAMIKMKPQPKKMIKRLVLTMAEVGVGKSNVFQSLFTQYLQLAKDRGEQEPNEEDGVGERKEGQDEREKAVHPPHYGESSSQNPNRDLRLATRSKSETDLVLSTNGGNMGYTEEKGATDTNMADVKVKKGIKKRRSSEGAAATPKKAEAENGVKFLADVVANEEEAIKKTWRKLKL